MAVSVSLIECVNCCEAIIKKAVGFYFPWISLHKSRVLSNPNILSGGEIVSTFDTPENVKFGSCDLIEEVMIGEDRLLRFSGVPLGMSLLGLLSSFYRRSLLHRSSWCYTTDSRGVRTFAARRSLRSHHPRQGGEDSRWSRSFRDAHELRRHEREPQREFSCRDLSSVLF